MSKKVKLPRAVLIPNITPEVVSGPENDDKPFDFFSDAIKAYWETGHFSDVVISVKGYNIRAHRMIICSQSTMLSHFVHSLARNAKTIKIPDTLIVNFNLFKAMIAWMYGIDYMYPEIASKTYIHAAMYDMAIRFGVPRLRKHALKKIKESTEIPEADWDARAFLRMLNEVLYKPYHECMRFLLLDICRRKMEALLKEPELEPVLKYHRGFGRELMRSLAQKGPVVRCLECGSFCREGRCANEKCTCDEDWRPYFR